jgi:hypothetical protein
LAATKPHDTYDPEDESASFVQDQLETLVDEWVGSSVDHYEGWFGNWPGALLVEASRVLSDSENLGAASFPPDVPPWPTLTSMRDVDAESSVYLVRTRRSSR